VHADGSSHDAGEPLDGRLIHSRQSVAAQNREITAIVIVLVESGYADPQAYKNSTLDTFVDEKLWLNFIKEFIPKVLPNHASPR
jgi:hypothetical protein